MSSVSPRTALMIAGLMILISQSPLIEYNSYTTSGNEPVLDDTDEQLFVGEQHDVSLVKNIKVETGHAGAPGSGDVDYITKMGSNIYFQAEDTNSNGLELWKSDGTASGTIMLKDICPQVNCDGNPGPGETLGSNREMTVIGNTLYFEASSTYCASSPCSTELWKTDGTTSGTVMVKEWNANYGGLKYMTPLGNTLFFQANDGTNGSELWKSDGTESGTMMVKDINTEIGQLGSDPTYFTPIGNTLYFAADDGISSQHQLWKSDGTESGTIQVLNLSTTSGVGLKAIGDTLFFWGNNDTNGSELWKYDTASPMSASNPIMVKDITSGSAGTSSHLTLMTVVGNTLYFAATSGSGPPLQLYKSDGTESGTGLVTPMDSESPKSIDSLSGIHKAGDKVFFAATTNTQWGGPGSELWTSDGTENGTYLVKDICPNSCSGYPRNFFTLGDIVFFSANDGTNGTELWRSDGTESGTMMVQDINPGGSGSSINGNFVLLGDTVYFSASNSTYGADELWKMTNVTGNPIGSASISPYSTSALLNVDEEMTPLTFDWVGGPHNGNNTVWLASDVQPGASNGKIGDITVLGSRLYFKGNSGDGNGSELYAYNPADNTSWMVADINPGGNSDPIHIVASGTRLYFSADDGTHGHELWAYEETNDTAWIVNDTNPSGSGQPLSITPLGTRVYFRANDGTNGNELWAYEETNDTAWLVNDANPGAGGGNFGYIVASGTRVYFSGDDGTNGRELWAYEETNDTAWMVADIHPTSHSSPGYIVASGTRLYFQAENDSTYGKELWAYEETNDTVWMVDEFNLGIGDSTPANMIVSGSRLYFSAQDGTNGYEVWTYEETSDTAWMITGDDGVNPSYPPNFGVLGTRIFFDYSATWDNRPELWSYEETNDTAWRIDRVNQGLAYPSKMIILDNRVYFTANDGVVGAELWAYDPSLDSGGGPRNGPVTNATCEISPALPAGLSLTQGTCTISGTPTEFQNNTNYILWINESGVLDAAFVNIEVQDPEQINLSPDDVTVLLTNNTTMSPMTFNWVVSGTGSSGSTASQTNGTTWQVADINPGSGTSFPASVYPTADSKKYALVGTTVYFSANDGTTDNELWAFNSSNGTTWLVVDINDAGHGSPGNYGGFTLVGTTLYFDADDGMTGRELWAHDTSNGATWRVADINPGDSNTARWYGITLVGTTLYFDADDGGLGRELWAHDTSNGTTWMTSDINNGSSSGLDASGGSPLTVFGDTLYFEGRSSNARHLWAHDTSNGTSWMVSDLITSPGGHSGFEIIGDTLYFDAVEHVTLSNETGSGTELWAHNTTNGTTWLIEDLRVGVYSSYPGRYAGFEVIGDVLFFDCETEYSTVRGHPCAYDTTNETLWVVNYTHDNIGTYLFKAMGDTLYYGEGSSGSSTADVFAYSVTNATIWNITVSGNPGWNGAAAIVGDILYFDVGGYGGSLGAYNASNDTFWEVGNPADYSLMTYAKNLELVGNLLLFSATDGNNGTELWAYGAGNVATGASGPDSGPVANATCEISPALSAGLSMAQGTCTISGTPTATQPSTVYTLVVNESGVSDTATIDITVQEMLPDPPSISPESVSVTLMRTVVMGPITFTNIGGDIDTWEVDPALPDGLFLSTSGTISGIPTTVQAAGVYDIWANNSGGSDYAIVTITVEEYIPDPPEISYTSSVVLTQYLQMTPIVPTNTGGVADTWEISPALSLGLILSADGTISGTPTSVESGIVYTIWANNTGGSGLATQIITVEAAPDGLSTSSPSILLVRDGTMLPWYFNYNGGEITTWEISPELPAGLTFDIASKSIIGTPTEMMAATVFTIWANGSEISESINVTIEVLEDTDGDGMPDSLGSHTNTGLIEDLDDDADGISDVDEFASTPATDSLLPDTDGDGICDGSINVTIRDVQICEGGPDAFPTDPSAWDDTDGDGDPDNIEGNSTSEPPLVEDLDDDGDGIPDENESAEGSLTDSLLPDTDGDGVCDGAIDVTYDDELICTGGPDAFPDDPTEWVDTDGDEIGNNADLDDDGDQASDEDEIAAGTDPLDPLDFPTDDTDGDGWTDAQEDFCGTDKLDNTSIPADNDADLWCDSDDPDDDNDGWFDTDENDCGTDPLDVTSVPGDRDGDGICDSLDTEPQEEGDGGFPWWLCSLLFLALIIVLPLIMRLVDDAMPENTRVRPEVSGAGTRDDPFILTPLEGISPGESILSKETITITKMTPELKVHIVDLKEKENGRKFLMVDEVLSDERVTMIVATEDGTMDFRMSFSDSFNPTPSGGTFQSTLKVGRNSVYFMWDVAVNSDPDYVKSVVKPSSGETTVVSLQIDSEEDEKPAKKVAAKAKAKKAEEAEERAAEAESEAKAKKAAAKTRVAEAEARAAEAEADARVAEAEARAAKAEVDAKKATDSVPLTKEEKKAAGLERVKANAAKIDFGTIGIATVSEKDDLQVVKGIGPFIEEKLNALGIYTFQQISKMSSELEDQVNEAIEFFPGRVKRDQWVIQCKTLLSED